MEYIVIINVKGSVMISEIEDTEFPQVDIESIKNIIKNIDTLNLRNGKALTPEQKTLKGEINRVFHIMFAKCKLDNEDFTLAKDEDLKKIRINEDDDGISPQDLMYLYEYLDNNFNAFYELVARFFMQDISGNFIIDNQIFYLSLNSKLTAKEEDCFFIFNSGEFWIFTDELTNISLEQVVSDCFGHIIDRLKEILNWIKIQASLTHEQTQNILRQAFNKYLDTNNGFQKGAITFFDFLGWKGLWLNSEKDHLKVVSELIDDFRKKLKIETEKVYPYCLNMKVSKLLSISDTIVLFTPELSIIDSKQLLELHANMARYVVEQSVLKQYPIRGAITLGEYNSKNNVMIGPGIDECASWHEMCDWIGVHLTPSAQLEYERNKIDNIMRYKIPVKRGVPNIEYCVKWIIENHEFDLLFDKAKPMLPQIAAKYLNTRKFLDVVREEENNGQDGVGQ